MHAHILVLSLALTSQAYAQQPSPMSEDRGRSGTDSLLEKRIILERESIDNPFVITPHKPNYILPASYNSSPNNAAYRDLVDEIDNTEIKFQLSLKFSVWRNIFGDNGHLALAYTQQSYWQAYNSDISAPFRETNHEPEAMLSFFNDVEILGFRNSVVTFGLVHQSNGRASNLSRSWNRIYTSLILEKDNLVLSLKPWYRIPEDSNNDDNPDIDKYLGHGELGAVYQMGTHTFGLLLRNNLRSENRGAVQVDWSFPVSKNKLKGYVQYFNGYGESLIDYDSSVNRIGAGIILTNWL